MKDELRSLIEAQRKDRYTYRVRAQIINPAKRKPFDELPFVERTIIILSVAQLSCRQISKILYDQENGKKISRATVQRIIRKHAHLLKVGHLKSKKTK